MTAGTKTAEAGERTPEAEVRSILKSLARAERAVKDHEEPRAGSDFERKLSLWRRLYRKAMATGQQIEAEEG